MVQLRPKKIKQKTKPFRMLLQAKPIWLTYIFANTVQVSATTVKKKKKGKTAVGKEQRKKGSPAISRDSSSDVCRLDIPRVTED